jgi:tetratricopeptide (TPR) repeat protein
MKTIFTFLLLWIFSDQSHTGRFHSYRERIVGSSEDPSARKDFERALLLLHNFEYPDAAELFREAQRKDPAYALAYWGEAMTYNHPVWLSQDAISAREVLKRYEKAAKANTRELPSLDKDLLRSLDFLYGEGNKRTRDEAYADFMATLYEKYKGNQDVAAFYALSLLGFAGGWDEELCNKAAEVAGAILKEDPRHPGALHYFIHSEDHPEFARLAWDQANEYAKVASYSGHALHMPSHIYLALGLWDDVVRSNEISWRAGVDRKEAKKLTNDALNYHGHWWLEYGYLQQGRFKEAEQLLTNQLAFTRALPSPSARTHFVIMRGHYLVESGDWQNKLAKEEVKIEDLRIEIRTLDRFVKGLSTFKNHDQINLKKIIAEIRGDIAQAEQMKVMNEGISQCKGGGSYSKAIPSRAGINQASILMEELNGLLAFMNKDIARASAHFTKAITLEEENGHFFGPPEILKLAHEFYGEFLLTIDQPAKAIVNFEKALQKAPGRNQSLLGLMEASGLTGDRDKETRTGAVLDNNIRNADRQAVAGFLTHP